MKNSVLLFALVAMLCFSCSDSKETTSGQKYTIARKGDGVLAKAGEIRVLNFLLKDGKDSVINDSKKNPMPVMLQHQDSVPKGDVVTEIIQLLSKGDSVTFIVSAKNLFQGGPYPPEIDSASSFKFFMGVTDIINADQARALQSAAIAKQNEQAMLDETLQLAKDTTAIAEYLKAKSIVAQSTPSGLHYVMNKAGKGENAKPGQTVKVGYSGFLLDGTCFDTSSESVARANNVFYEQRMPYEPYEFTLGNREVIGGWDEAIAMMNKGAKMTVYIPSGLAYGPQRRSEIIVENSILMFDLELVDIK
jgi:FKBP-type peptidyl-prolyl cis-trans isomerase FkpA